MRKVALHKSWGSMCKIIDDIVQRERKETEKKANVDTALRMIDEGIFTNEQIAKISNLPLNEVEELVKGRSA